VGLPVQVSEVLYLVALLTSGNLYNKQSIDIEILLYVFLSYTN
jgi:hypothetical protein